MSHWTANHYIAVVLLAGLLVMFAGLAGAAERSPFVAALVVCEPSRAGRARIAISTPQ